MQLFNLFSGLPGKLPEELVDTLASSGNVRIERIVSQGHASAPGFWYDQQQHEWVMVLQGEASLRFERDDRLVHMKPGDSIDIPAHEKHRVEWTTNESPTVWLAVFYD